MLQHPLLKNCNGVSDLIALHLLLRLIGLCIPHKVAIVPKSPEPQSDSAPPLVSPGQWPPRTSRKQQTRRSHRSLNQECHTLLPEHRSPLLHNDNCLVSPRHTSYSHRQRPQGSFQILARFIDSWIVPCSEAPSPKKHTVT